MRGIRAATRAGIASAMSRVDADRGLPRCERLAGNLSRADGGPTSVLTCPCTDAAAPHADCPYATRTTREPIRLADAADGLGDWLYPVPDDDARARAALTTAQRAAIVTVPDSEVFGATEPERQPDGSIIERRRRRP